MMMMLLNSFLSMLKGQAGGQSRWLGRFQNMDWQENVRAGATGPRERWDIWTGTEDIGYAPGSYHIPP